MASRTMARAVDALLVVAHEASMLLTRKRRASSRIRPQTVCRGLKRIGGIRLPQLVHTG
ncbi:hypothetical protein [Breoghania sp. L-A4]|uniref:hypothetical protein n=1 Tax=Breoghania sp. L-A4 TaxID=2304600 RepID=UPI0013C2EA88|nr:hypothetical protein [Breoghania sp. L-A4]